MAYQSENCKTSTKAANNMPMIKAFEVVDEEQKKDDEKEKLRLRDSYSSLLEEYLDALGYKHWGMSLEQKMQRYRAEALETMERWASINGLVLYPDEELSVKDFKAFREYEDELLRKPVDPKRKGCSMFIELLDTIDVNVEYFLKQKVKKRTSRKIKH